MKQNLYESKISNAKWIAYDLPGNVGWITYIVCMVKHLRRGVTVFSSLSIFPALLMLIGIAELVSERIQKLDRVLPRARLLRGFGALTLGGALGILTSLVEALWLDGGSLALWMLSGAVLCALFAWLIFREYKKKAAQGYRHSGGSD